MNKKSINKKKGGSSSNFSKLSNELKRKIIKKYSNSNTENALASRLFSLTSRNGYKRVVENKEGNKSIKNKEYNRIITKPAQIFMNKFNNFSTHDGGSIFTNRFMGHYCSCSRCFGLRASIFL